MGKYYDEYVGEYFVHEKFWNANEVAEIFGISRYTVCDWAAKNGIVKEGKRYSFDEDDLISFAKQSEKYELAYFRWKVGGDLSRFMRGEVDIY